MDEKRREVSMREVIGFIALFLSIAIGLVFIALNEGNLRAKNAHVELIPESDSGETPSAPPNAAPAASPARP